LCTQGILERRLQVRFADFVLDIDRRELKLGSALVTIGPQVFDLLVYLIRNRERVVSKDELMEAVWAGRIVSESTLTSHINAVRKAVGDSGDEQRLIRTVARKGFRFVGDIKEHQDHAVDVGARTVEHTTNLGVPNRPSIAVLPFQNLSGDPEQEYFADGIVEDIINRAVDGCAWRPSSCGTVRACDDRWEAFRASAPQGSGVFF